jgi:hypothetical protein
MNEISYIIQQLLNIGFSSSEVTSFLTNIYTNKIIYNKDLESQINQSGNLRYIEGFSLLSEDIYILDNSKLKEWYNNL